MRQLCYWLSDITAALTTVRITTLLRTESLSKHPAPGTLLWFNALCFSNLAPYDSYVLITPTIPASLSIDTTNLMPCTKMKLNKIYWKYMNLRVRQQNPDLCWNLPKNDVQNIWFSFFGHHGFYEHPFFYSTIAALERYSTVWRRCFLWDFWYLCCDRPSIAWSWTIVIAIIRTKFPYVHFLFHCDSTPRGVGIPSWHHSTMLMLFLLSTNQHCNYKSQTWHQ